MNQAPNIGLLDFLTLLTSSRTMIDIGRNDDNITSLCLNQTTPDKDCEQALSEPNSSTSHHRTSTNQSADSFSSTDLGKGSISNSSKDLNFKPYVKEIRFEEQTFSAISCKYCRRNHRKCTRNLPSCSNCSKRGIKCEYERKNGSKNISSSEVIVSIQNPSLNDTSNALHINKTNILGFYTMHFYEIIPKNVFAHMLENLEETGNDFRAVVFSLQAWREQRLGSKEYSEICFQHAKLLLAPYMDCFKNNYAAMALLNLAFVCQGKRKYKEQSMYLDIVRYFVTEIVEYESRNNTITPDMKNLIKWDTNVRSSLKFLLLTEKNGPMSIVNHLPNLIKTCLGFDLRNMGLFELSTLDKSKINDMFNVLDVILRPFTQKLLCPSQENPNHPTAQIMSIFVDILHNGLKLALTVTIDNSQIDEIWNLSTIVTKAAKSPLFPFVPLFVVPFVDLAISEHARLAPIYSRNGVSLEKAMVMMEDMEVISALNAKLDRVDDFYLNLQKNVQSSVQVDHMNMAKSSFSVEPNNYHD